MVANPAEREWDPSYDEAELEQTINRISRGLTKSFYLIDLPCDDEPCQGDIIELPSDLPIIGADGEAAAISAKSDFWLVAGNSCDLSRARSEVLYAPIIPLMPLATLAPTPHKEVSLRLQESSRLFFVHPWDGAEAYLADFTRFVSVHRDALDQVAKRRARMTREYWILLNACLLRLLARADRRHL